MSDSDGHRNSVNLISHNMNILKHETFIDAIMKLSIQHEYFET